VRWRHDRVEVRRACLSADRVFWIGTASRDELKNELIATSRKTGTVEWRRRLEYGFYALELGHDVVYVASLDFQGAIATVSALEPTSGRELFTTEFPVPVRGNSGCTLDIVPLEERVFVIAGIGRSARAVLLE